MPNSNEIHYLCGEGRELKELSEMEDQGVILSSFDSKNLIAVENLVAISDVEFKAYQLATKSRSTKKAEYEHMFTSALEEMASSVLEKVILSRQIAADTNLAPLELFDRLNQNYPTTFNYLISNTEIGCWLGASPEVLFDLSDDIIETVSLAGTKSAREEWTQKEKDEQQYVTTYLVEALESIGAEDISVDGPQTISTFVVDHLKSLVFATIDNASWADVANRLHPTPAVCGFPKDVAYDFISAYELHQRSFYTGFIGIIEWSRAQVFVNLRCVRLDTDQACIFVGGGITKDSIVENEWEETNRKAKTILNLLDAQ